MVKGGYSDYVAEVNGKKVTWEVANDHVVHEGVEDEDLGLQGFGFYLFNEERQGCVGDDVKELLYLVIIMDLWPGD